MATPLDNAECVYQINTHLLYELKWLLFAATEFKRLDELNNNRHYMALIDSAFLHARNLFEFISMNKTAKFTLAALGGTSSDQPAWRHLINNRITHMGERENNKAHWPSGLNNASNDRFIKMSDAILTLLETQGVALKDAAIQKAYDKLIQSARAYLNDANDEHFSKLEALYDASRDGPTY